MAVNFWRAVLNLHSVDGLRWSSATHRRDRVATFNTNREQPMLILRPSETSLDGREISDGGEPACPHPGRLGQVRQRSRRGGGWRRFRSSPNRGTSNHRLGTIHSSPWALSWLTELGRLNATSNQFRYGSHSTCSGCIRVVDRYSLVFRFAVSMPGAPGVAARSAHTAPQSDAKLLAQSVDAVLGFVCHVASGNSDEMITQRRRTSPRLQPGR